MNVIGAFILRPVGGVLFGYLGDKFGRLFALRLSIYLMAFPTTFTALLPPYSVIGVFATLLFGCYTMFTGTVLLTNIKW